MSQTENKLLCEQVDSLDQPYSFVFHESSRDAIKQWAYYIEQLQLQSRWYGQGHIKLWLDTRKAVSLPFRYLFEMLSDYNRPYPNLNPPQITMAIVRSPDTVVLDIYAMMAELFDPPLTVQFFTSEDKARIWLNRS